jgi:transcriptional regulator with XRE-family HTH domain
MATVQPSAYGELLKRYRVAAGLSQEALVEHARLYARRQRGGRAGGAGALGETLYNRALQGRSNTPARGSWEDG